MIVILASRHDSAANSLAARWQAAKAAVLTPADLSNSGWRYLAGVPNWGSSVVAGRLTPNDEIEGVLTRLAFVDENELDHVHPEDRGYVAAEMNAFLLAWLSARPCRVLNQPSADCLCGPGWRRERWIRFASGLGIPVEPVRRDSSGGPSADTPADYGAVVTVVGERSFGTVHPSLADQALRLAAAAGVALLEVRFTGSQPGSRLSNVGLCPDFSQDKVADAVLDCFARSAEC